MPHFNPFLYIFIEIDALKEVIPAIYDDLISLAVNLKYENIEKFRKPGREDTNTNTGKIMYLNFCPVLAKLTLYKVTKKISTYEKDTEIMNFYEKIKLLQNVGFNNSSLEEKS